MEPGMILSIVGLAGFTIAFIFLMRNIIKKKPVRIPALLIAISLITLIIGISLIPIPEDELENSHKVNDNENIVKVCRSINELI